MIAAVPLRLLYLIFRDVLGLILLMGRTASMTWTDRALLAALIRLLPTRRHLGLLVTPACEVPELRPGR